MADPETPYMTNTHSRRNSSSTSSTSSNCSRDENDKNKENNGNVENVSNRDYGDTVENGSNTCDDDDSSNGNNNYIKGEERNIGETYYVNKIMDIRWVRGEAGNEEPLYRVRWFGYDALSDSWEPEENLRTCMPILQKFLDYYEEMRAQRTEYLRSIGVSSEKADSRHVNILSEHISHITKKSCKKNSIQKQNLYRVVWQDEDAGSSWEPEDCLAHASDKLEEYTRMQRLKRIKVSSKKIDDAVGGQEEEENPDHVRRVKDRKFFEDLRNGELPMQGDLYSRVKSRRASDRSQSTSTSPGTSTWRARCSEPNVKSKKRSRRTTSYSGCPEMAERRETSSPENNLFMENDDEVQRQQQQQEQIDLAEQRQQVDEEEEDDEEERLERLRILQQQQKWQQQEEEECQKVPDRILAVAGLPDYDLEEMKEELKKMERNVVILSKKEFKKAVHTNNYSLVFDSMRSGHIPDVNLTKLFLRAAQHGMRDMALLLANQVPDLTVQNSWGENALTMAAKQGDIVFAYHLLCLGVPLNLCNTENKTAYEISTQLTNRAFRNFCKCFSLAQDVPLK